MPELTETALNTAAIITLGFGALICFFGYRVFLFFLALAGFLLAGAAAGFGGLTIAQDPAIGMVAALLGGFIGAVLLVLLYFGVIFLVGLVTGGVAALLAVHLFVDHLGALPVLVILASAVACGVVALFVQRLVIVIVSSADGALLMTLAGFYFLRRRVLGPALINLYDAASESIADQGLEAALRAGPEVSPSTLQALTDVFDPTSLYLMGLVALAIALFGISVQYAVTARTPHAGQATEK